MRLAVEIVEHDGKENPTIVALVVTFGFVRFFGLFFGFFCTLISLAGKRKAGQWLCASNPDPLKKCVNYDIVMARR